MDIKKSHSLSLDILFFIITAFFHFALVQGATVTAPNKSGILNEGLNLTCTYNLENGETFSSLTWARKRNSDINFIDIAKFGNGDAVYYEDAGELRNRSSLLKVTTGGNIDIRTLICVDEAQFKCTLEYASSGTLRNQESTMAVTLQGRPEKPSSLIPSGENAEYDKMTFDCTSVVGKTPLGSIKWEGIRGSIIQDLSADSEDLDDFFTPGSCTQTFISRLTRNVTRSDNGLVIRCRTIHSIYQDPEDYLDLSPLIVNYPVDDASLSVSQDPNVPIHDVGKRVRLVCQITVVPAATYKWRHLKTNQTYDRGTDGVLELVEAQVDQSGTYECEATNTYQNRTFTATQTIDINIQIPSTASPTDVPENTSPSNTGSGNGNTDKTTSTPDDDNTVLIIIICVVVAVVVLIAIIIFIIVKKKKSPNKQQRIEEPPEKAYNNNPAINSYANQPDLVGDDKKKNYQNSFSSSPYNSNPYSPTNYPAHNTSFSMKSDDLSYGEMNFDDRPRSRKPVALSDADYADISMPHV
ncbi:uncharacterized protein LOC126829465 [Patella vulgata]|uniref:uncharacterized protein LOC126829465 n=1 Tax=Patella vulgata TaxID=6465 RepID=UPI00217F2C9F|nr:uncharacterized protein LOC126829465 [Patella vulgata]